MVNPYVQIYTAIKAFKELDLKFHFSLIFESAGGLILDKHSIVHTFRGA